MNKEAITVGDVKDMNVLSLYDGMSCGMLAMLKAGIQVDNYYAYEIDKYAIQTSQHNFPEIKQCGDVFKGDYTQYEGIEYLIGGSPCTFWSIAQSPDKRETTASGLGWELFSQYVRALHEAKPKYFIYENNKSMSKSIRESISETFGFEPIMINSALVSAQNRQRLYWVGKRNADGTYSKVDVQQPEDRGILLRDVLDGADLTNCDKAYCLTSSYDGACAWNTIERHQRSMVAEPVNVTTDGKAQCLRATCYKDTVRNIAGNDIDKKTGVAEPVACRCRGRTTKDGKGYAKYECREDNKSNTLDTNTTNGNMVAEPVCIASRGRYSDTDSRSSKTDAPTYQHYEARTDGKTNAVTTVSKDNLIGEPVCMRYERSEKAKQLRKDYESGKIKHGYHEYHELQPRTDGKTNTLIKESETVINGIDKIAKKLGYVPEMFNAYNAQEIKDKSPTLTTGSMETSSCAVNRFENINCYAIPVEFDGDIPIKAVSGADDKTYTVYEVKDGNITIKGKTYQIKLIDGYYIIRKLTVSECKRLQTVPEWYEFPVSATRAYKMLGNGWTVDVIAHLIEATKIGKTVEKIEQLSLF